MTAYIYIFSLILCGQFFVSKKFISKNKYCLGIAIFCSILAGLRSFDLGLGDTDGVYFPIYKAVSFTNGFSDVLFLFFDAHFGNDFVANSSGYSIGFLLLAKISSICFDNYHFFLLWTSFLYFFSISRIISKYSNIPAIAFVAFLALNGFSSSFYLVRHILGVSFLMFALEALLNGKNIKFLILVLIAASIHISMLVFLIAYPIKRVSISSKVLLIFALLSAFFGIMVKTTFFSVVSQLGGFMSYYSVYASSESGHFASLWFIGFLIFLFAFTYYKKLIINNYLNSQYFKFALLYCIFLSFQVIIDEFNRVALFFLFAPSILLSNTVDCIKNPYKKVLVSLVILLGFGTYWFLINLKNYNMLPYHMFFTF
ncbi:MAG: EpsG family protein [Fibrobacteraceae bacterium]|nr:EpsG family protein [Fibrobacteraceae bacterium]